MDQEKLISVKEVIKKARARGFDFGRGKPTNLLYYYTKKGLLPGASRVSVFGVKGHTVGCYPATVVDTMLRIQSLRQSGMSMAYIQTALVTPKQQLVTVRELVFALVGAVLGIVFVRLL